MSLVPSNADSKQLINEAVSLLEEHFRDRPLVPISASAGLTELLDEAATRSSALRQAEPLRIIRQFACTGGTLICRALAAQPNCTLISEVDPFNTNHLSRQKRQFAPTDLIQLADDRFEPLNDEIKEDMFLSALRVLFTRLALQGRRLILREHTHGRFCTDSDPDVRKSISDLVKTRFDNVLTVVSVRHPMDSFLSLKANNWQHFSPFTIDEYANRYLKFLDECVHVKVFRYEDFVKDPDKVLHDLCRQLDLPFNPSWAAIIPHLKLTGDSGRTSRKIISRERREVPPDIAEYAQASAAYRGLCKRLGYSPGT